MFETAGAIAGAVLAVGGVLSGIWAMSRVKGVETSIKILNDANMGLRSANADLEKKLHDSEKVCADRISKLEGQNQALTQTLGENIVTSISDHLEKALDRIVNRALERMESRSA